MDFELNDEMNGLELWSEFKYQKPELKGIMITAFPTIKICKKALWSGLADYIEKPFKVDELFKVIEKII